ncbi:MAG: hypothetical protein M5U26_04385 [Planctomycetota bacterium]|nr:hypothetical protein [Planctomycetota bacterium]
MNERVYLRTGAFNLGFMGLRAGEPARRFLDWWTRRMREYCVCDPASGFFADQKWLDLAPSLFDGVAVLRSPGYNVAAWNLGDRPLARDGEGWTAAGAPLAAMHFSAFDPSNPEDPAWLRAGPGVVPDAPPALLELARAYAERLRAHGWETCRGWAHAYDAFDDGQPIPPLWHIYYRDVLRHRLPADYDPYAGLPYSPALGLLRQLRGDPARFRETWWYREWLRALRYAGRIPPWWDPHAQA